MRISRPSIPRAALLCAMTVYALTAGPVRADVAQADDTEPVYLYDLRYATGGDARDAAHVLRAWDHAHTIAALQGLANRQAPRLYLLAVMSQVRQGQCIDAYWLDYLRRTGVVPADRPVKTIDDIETLVQTFRPFVRGAVVYDPNVAATSNVASTVAGADDLLPIRYDLRPGSLYQRLVQDGPRLPVRVWLVRPNGRSLFTGKGTIPDTPLPSTGSAKCDAYLWMK
ncbi:MAG TPA: hypothetical protein ENN87_03540, partial [Phycisphaerales bacterium]|nr:hypothetical protein [Phycisphaerales bacterium]